MKWNFVFQLRNLAFKKIPQKSSHGGCLSQHEQKLHATMQKDSQEENWQEWRQRDEQVQLTIFNCLWLSWSMLISEVICYADLFSFNVVHYVYLLTPQFIVESAVLTALVCLSEYLILHRLLRRIANKQHKLELKSIFETFIQLLHWHASSY